MRTILSNQPRKNEIYFACEVSFNQKVIGTIPFHRVKFLGNFDYCFRMVNKSVNNYYLLDCIQGDVIENFNQNGFETKIIEKRFIVE